MIGTAMIGTGTGMTEMEGMITIEAESMIMIEGVTKEGKYPPH